MSKTIALAGNALVEIGHDHLPFVGLPWAGDRTGDGGVIYEVHAVK
ncbi:hypothetical protein [Pyruvatibacter sp.]